MDFSFDLPTSTAGPSVPQPPSDDGSVPKPYAKTHRSSQACNNCHSRKTRCSGGIPCKFCLSRNIPCVVSDSATRSSGSKRARLSSTSSNATPGPSTKSIQHSIPTVPATLPSVLAPTHEKIIYSPPTRNPLPLSSLIGGHSLPHAVMNSPPQQQYPQQQQQRAFGQLDLSAYAPPRIPSNPSPSGASSVSFQDATQDNEHSVSGIMLTRYQRPPAKISEPHIPTLIDRRSSVKYFDAYFSEAEFLYQLFPLPQYISAYHEAIWATAEGVANDALNDAPIGTSSILAALLALGAIFERRLDDAELLYRAARQSYLDIIDLATLESIQLALQLAVFEINTSRSKSLWCSLAVAVRLSHCLNLHRKPALTSKGPAEVLRRSQLWYNGFVHDCWLSLTSGRPPLSAAGDSDLDPPWLPVGPGQPRLCSSPIFGMRVRLSEIWTHVHDKLYRRRLQGPEEVPWLTQLPLLERELQVWAADMHKMSVTVATNRPDKKQLQAILLAQGIIRLIMHRSFLIQRYQLQPQQAFNQQRQVSEAAVLDGALTVIETCKRLIELGIHLSFWFLTVNLQIACLALCEYLQNQHEKPTGTDTSRPEQGLKTATSLLQNIADSGENPAVSQVLDAVKAIQQAWMYQIAHQAQQSQMQQTQAQQVPLQPPTGMLPQYGGSTLQAGISPVDSATLFNDANLPFANDIAPNDFFGAPIADFDWLNNFGVGGNIFDGFVASPAPAAENLAWWIAPRGSESM